MAPGDCTRLSSRQSILLHTHDATSVLFLWPHFLHLDCGCDKIEFDLEHLGSLSYLSHFLYNHMDILKSFTR